MGPALTIFIALCFNLRSITKESNAPDPRYEVLKGVIKELRGRGHTILIRAVTDPAREFRQIKQLHDPIYGEYDPENKKMPKIDAQILWWAYNGPRPNVEISRVLFKMRRKTIKHYSQQNIIDEIPTVFYENGFTQGDVTVDPSGLLGSSYYLYSLNDIVQADYDDKRCTKYLKRRVEAGGWSKRPQDDNLVMTESLPSDHILGKYLYSNPKLSDLSITQYSNVSMPELLRKTARFCHDRDLPMVIKIHPHVRNSEQRRQRTIVDQKLALLAGDPSRIFVSNTSIGFLTKNAKFTTVLNAGTIVDALYMQAPILTTAINLFAYTDAVVYDPDVKRGLDTMNSLIDRGEWNHARKLRQRQVACWLARASMNMQNSVTANIAILEFHFAQKYPGFSFDGPHLKHKPYNGDLPPLRGLL